MTTLLKQGVLFKDLSESEKSEIQNQFPKINLDPSILKYRFKRILNGKWYICNAMEVPMKTKRMELI